MLSEKKEDKSSVEIQMESKKTVQTPKAHDLR